MGKRKNTLQYGMRGDVLPDGLCHDPDWINGGDLEELDFGEQARAIKLDRRQFEALVEYGD